MRRRCVGSIPRAANADKSAGTARCTSRTVSAPLAPSRLDLLDARQRRQHIVGERLAASATPNSIDVLGAQRADSSGGVPRAMIRP